MILRTAKCALLGMAMLTTALAQEVTIGGTRYITYQASDDQTVYLEDNRKPSLYTQNFGDCLGNSLINVTRFDAAYYKDNMTVLFHLAGNSALLNESVMMYIGVYAYGESRFDLTFNPCLANIYSMCPVNSSIPISANGIIPVSQNDVANIPDIALSIPDFEGQAILRIFANETQSEIGCYSAVVTNGATFSQPAGLGSVLGVFTLTALVASFATAAYGEAIPTMRLHYAHSLSVGVVFAVFQHIFYTGALSMNWPSVLVAWWSNFAWAGGMIYTDSMQRSISRLIGNDVGSTLSVGAAPSGQNQPSLGGGYDIHKIYGRSLPYPMNHPLARDIASEIYNGARSSFRRRDVTQKLFERTLARRDDLANASTGYKWYGSPVGVGLPLPGNFSGFAGTLAVEDIPISNAFLTGFLWLLILLLVVIGIVAIFRGILEIFSRQKWMPQNRMAFFRKHWLTYIGALVLRACFIAWFMIMFLTIFQFTYQSPASVKAIAAIVFIIFLVGMPGIAIYACIYKWRRDNTEPAVLKKIPFLRKKDSPAEPVAQESARRSVLKFWKHDPSRVTVDAAEYSIHDDEDYIMKFGWLASRFRRTKWWFFSYWLFYEFVRACFYGGASGHPLVQVFGLLIVEILAFIFVLWAKPFEGKRLNVLVVYCLGFSKVTTVALSAAFDVQFNLERITTTAIGIVIIVIQGILMIITCIAIVVGAISSYMSVSRNKEDFRPRKWHHLRERYFDHLDRVVNDLPPEPKPEKTPEPEPEPEAEMHKGPYFEMKNMKRVAKIEDADEIAINESRTSLGSRPFPPFAESRPESQQSPITRSRAASVGSMGHGHLPFGARAHKASWSTKDFDSWNEGTGVQTPIDMTKTLPEDTAAPPPAHVRSNSRGSATIRHQLSHESLRIQRQRSGSGRKTPTFDEGKGKMPMLTPAQESEEFQTTYFDKSQR